MECVYEFIANTADGAFAIDRHQTIVMWNAAATAITGRRTEEVLGRKCFAIMRGRDVAGCAICRSGCPLFAAGERLEPTAAIDIASETADGRERWLNVSTILVPSRNRELSVLVHLFRETTQQHEIDRLAHELASLVSSIVMPASESHPLGADAHSVVIDLTRREREILAHLTQGESTETIAERLFISTHTVRNHVTAILAKLGVHSQLEAVAHAARNTVLSLGWCVLAALTYG